MSMWNWQRLQNYIIFTSKASSGGLQHSNILRTISFRGLHILVTITISWILLYHYWYMILSAQGHDWCNSMLIDSLTRWKNVLEKRVECMRFYFHLNLALEARLHSLCSNCITGFRMMASTISCRERRKNRILMQLGYLSMLPLNLSNIIFVVMGIFGNCVTCLRGIM